MSIPKTLACATAVVLFLGLASAQQRSLSGTWCVEDEDLAITFLANDSVRVRSEEEDGVNGFGTYEKRDTMFVARIGDGEMAVEMGYRYEWKSDSVIEAQTLFMTVDGDSVNLPEGTVLMKRCAPPDSAAAQPSPGGTDTGKRSSRRRRAQE